LLLVRGRPRRNSAARQSAQRFEAARLIFEQEREQRSVAGEIHQGVDGRGRFTGHSAQRSF